MDHAEDQITFQLTSFFQSLSPHFLILDLSLVRTMEA